jgi:hypothetical protein
VTISIDIAKKFTFLQLEKEESEYFHLDVAPSPFNSFVQVALNN